MNKKMNKKIIQEKYYEILLRIIPIERVAPSTILMAMKISTTKILTPNDYYVKLNKNISLTNIKINKKI